MLIFWKEKIALLAVPKTGTTALETALADRAAIAALRPPHVKHMTLRKFDRFLRPYLASMGLDGVETVALMREPVDWLASWYRYRRRDDLRGSANSTAGVSFDSFVESYLLDGDRPAHAALGSQARQLSGSGGKGVDHLFRYEDMDRARAFLAGRFGRQITLERVNESPPMTLDLSARLRARLHERLAEDFALYASID